MAVALRESSQCIDFFQQTILRAVYHWQESEEVQRVDVPHLDRNRTTILNIIRRGLEYQPSWPALKQLVIAFASYMERRGHWEVWRDILDAAIGVARTLNDVDAEITLTALFARLSQRQSRVEDVVRYYRRVIRLAKQHGNQYEEARACSNLGYYYIDGGHWWRSEVLSRRALALFEELESEHGQAHTHNHLGLLYTRQHMWNKAEHHLKHACVIWQSIDDQHSLIYGFDNLGILYYEKKHFSEALTYLEKAFELIDRVGENNHAGSVQLNTGLVYRQLGEIDVAETYFRQAEESFKQDGNLLGLAQAKGNLGEVYLAMERWFDALSYLEYSLKGVRELSFYDGEAKVLVNLIKYNLSQQNPSQATSYLHDLEELLSIHHWGKQNDQLNQQILDFKQHLYPDLIK